MGGDSAHAQRRAVGLADCPVYGTGSQNGAQLHAQIGVVAVSAQAGVGDAARSARGLAQAARAGSELLGTHPLSGIAGEPRLRRRVRHRAQCGAALAHGSGRRSIDAVPLRNGARATGAGRLGPGPGTLRLGAGGRACVRADARLLASRMGRGVRERAAASAAGGPRTRLCAFWRPAQRAAVRPHADSHRRSERGESPLEQHVRCVRAALGLRAEAVPALSRANEGADFILHLM